MSKGNYEHEQKIMRRDAFQIPLNLTPTGTRCIQVSIPDDNEYEEQFFSVLTLLTKWNSFQNDPDRNATKVASTWRSALWGSYRRCNLPAPNRGYESEDTMPIRVDCDCNVFVLCCDGTEKQILTSDQVKALLVGQPGGGSPQPDPNGGTACYDGKMLASGQFLIPTPVSTGDKINVTITGAGNDGDDLDWRCPDGSIFFAGACGGIPAFEGGDPLPSAPHMAAILNVNGTWTLIASGSDFTVPGGVSGVQPFIQLNDPTLAGNYGEYSVHVCVTNNHTTTFTHHFDFRLGTFGWQQNLFGGNSNAIWTPGAGYSSSITGPLVAGEGTIDIHLNAPHSLSHINLRMVGFCSDGSVNGQALYLNPGGFPPQTVGEVHGQNGSGAIDFQHVFVASDASVAMQIIAGTLVGQTCTVTDAYISADGVDPF